MKKLIRRKLVASALLLTVAAFLFVAFSVGRAQPKSGIIVQGVPLETWVEDILRSNDYKATGAVKEAGTNALPLLQRAMHAGAPSQTNSG